MGTQGTGRKRSTKKDKTTAEDDALNLIAREAEARLAAKRAARAEAREIRMKELERQQKEVYKSKYPMTCDTRYGIIQNFMLGQISEQHMATVVKKNQVQGVPATCCYRLEGDELATVIILYPLSMHQDALAEVEEKYRKAMVSNAQLDNEKNNLMYQVDTLKDSLMELEELLTESRREHEEKVKEYEREKYAHSVLQFQFNEMKETLKQSEELLNEIRQLRLKQEGFVREITDLQETVEWKDKKIGALERQKEYTDAIRIERDELREEAVKLKDILKKHGIVLGPDLSINGDVDVAEADESSKEEEVGPEQQQEMHEKIRLRKLVDEREKMIEQVKKLKAQLEQKTQKNGTDTSPDAEIIENGNDPNIMELQRDSNRQISELKFKLVKAEQEATALEQNVTRLEGQVTRYKSAAENAEKIEDDLKAEKRKLQRELRSALDKIEELESNNSHLSKRLEKMKSSRGMAQTP
uniref:Leucine rich repeat (in FLII) interacting protein 1a n=1 Tax=Astatotilapia calliptera TaxID=8154 RepID=A0AAX7VD10_ASTCA